MSRRISIAAAAFALAAAALPATAGAQDQGLHVRLANVRAHTTEGFSVPVRPARGRLYVHYLCTSRLGGRVTVAPTALFGSETRNLRCDGRVHQLRFQSKGARTVVSLRQFTAARTAMSVWQ